MQQINLMQRLSNYGEAVSFTFLTNDGGKNGKVISQTTSKNTAFISEKLSDLMNVIDGCGSLSEQTCQYLACHGKIRDLINLKLQNYNIDAGIAYVDQSISVVATDSNAHGRVITVLKDLFHTDSIKLTNKNLYLSKNIEKFLFYVKDSIPRPSSILLESKSDIKSSTCILTVTGLRELVENTIQIIKDKEQDYEDVSISIQDVCALKTDYLRTYRMHDISALEKKYSCHITIEAVQKGDIFCPQLSKTITIKCYQLNKNEINRQIHELIDNIVIEKEDSISSYSRIGRLCHYGESNHEFEHWGKQYQCLVAITGPQDNRYSYIFYST